MDSDDASVERVLSVASKAEKPPFAHLFTTKVAEDFTDQHIWLSIFTKRPHDRFSRIQRVTCCLVLLMTTMLTSAMFFNLGGASVYVFRIGSLIIDYKGIIIGIQSALIVIPINTIIMFLFKRSARNSSPETKAEERDRDLDETHETGTEMSESELNTIKSGSEKGFIQSDESMKQNRKRRYRTNRPTCLLVFAWLISVLAVAACIVVILFYSMIWGDTVTRQWLVSVFTGFFQSAFVIQPVKLIVVAMILALILRQPKEEDEVLDAYKKAPSNRADEDRLNFLKLIAKVKSR